MTTDLLDPESRTSLAALYRDTLLQDVIPFWVSHGMDAEHGGIITCLDRDGLVLDTDKSVWFQGRAGWMFATLYNTVERKADWLAAARSCTEFLRRHCFSPEGKLYFTVTREGLPLRMRRYVFSEAFASIAFAAYSKAAKDEPSAGDAVRCWENYLRLSFAPGGMLPKFDPATRPMKGLGPLMIGIVTAQELRENLGDVPVGGKTCTEWIDAFILEIERYFLKPGHEVLMETVGPGGEIIDHLDGRMLTPGHAIECAWFILQEGRHRRHQPYIELGLTILNWTWRRGWDAVHGGLLYFTDLHGGPVQEYWHNMKFWWPHCEGIIASLLAWKVTGEAVYAEMHRQVHEWSFSHFPDPECREWYGYLHRDGRISQSAKGNLFKGPFHLPRMLHLCWRELDSSAEKRAIEP